MRKKRIREKWKEHRTHTFISFKLSLRALFDFLSSCVLYYVGIITWKIFDMIVKTSETNCAWKGDFSSIIFFSFFSLSLSRCRLFCCTVSAWRVWFWLIRSISLHTATVVFLLDFDFIFWFRLTYWNTCGACMYFISSRFLFSFEGSFFIVFVLVLALASFDLKCLYVYLCFTIIRGVYMCIVYRNIILTARDIHHNMWTKSDWKCISKLYSFNIQTDLWDVVHLYRVFS